jgi:hypothetical protein
VRTIVLAFVLAWLAAAEKPHAWESAIVVSQEIQSPRWHPMSLLTVETSRYQFKWLERGDTPIIVLVNAPIQFYKDGDLFVVLDGKHHKHKFTVVGVAKK